MVPEPSCHPSFTLSKPDAVGPMLTEYNFERLRHETILLKSNKPPIEIFEHAHYISGINLHGRPAFQLLRHRYIRGM